MHSFALVQTRAVLSIFPTLAAQEHWPIKGFLSKVKESQEITRGQENGRYCDPYINTLYD